MGRPEGRASGDSLSVDREALSSLKIDRPDEPPRRSWAGLVLGILLLVITGGGVAMWVASGTSVAVMAAPVEAVESSGRSTVLNASGYVTARRQATISSKVTGKVVEVLIEEGMRVDEGQLLARLDAATPEASLRLAEAQSAAAKEALAETRVRIAEARRDLARAENLEREGVASPGDRDDAQAELDALQARLALQARQQEVADREVALARQQLDDTEIRAPFAGVVVSKDAQPGEMISPISAGGGFTRTGICTIVDMESLEVEVDVNEAYINRVHADQGAEVILDAYPDWRIPARVIAVIPTADRQKATVKVRIELLERDERVLPDMGVKVSFIESEAAEAAVQRTLLVPRQALVRDGDTDVVFVVSGGRAERRAVRVSGADGEKVRVAAGLTGGESVVLDPPAELTDGDRITVKESGA